MKGLTLILMLLITGYFLLITDTNADIPHTINYQGKLTDKQGYALTGTYNVTFRLYDAETGGNLLWTESHTNVSVQRGLFSVLLGTITPLNLPFDKQYYLSIQVGADPEMIPRQTLASSPYAFRAKTIDEIDTLASAFKRFGGDGSDGAKIVSGTENWDSIPKQFSSLTIDPGARLNVMDKIVIIGVSGDCTIAGEINAAGAAMNGAPGPGIYTGTNGGNAAGGGYNTPITSDAYVCALTSSLGGGGGGGGGGNNGGGNGGGSGGQGGLAGANPGLAAPSWKTTAYNSILKKGNADLMNLIANSIGGGGGSGGGNGWDYSGGGGGSGGGVIYIEVAGTLNLSGTITAKGNNGGAGGRSDTGNGGGGGGGCVIIRAKTISTNTGVINVSGGTQGGAGQPGGIGGVGFGFIDVVF